MAFNSNGGSVVPRQRIKKGNKATEPTDPTRTGYTFVEWDKGVVAYNFNTPVNSNFTLIAKWQINTYTVTISNASGESATLTYRKVGDENDTTETIANAGTFVLPVEVEEGDALSTVYSKLEATYGTSGTWSADLTTTISENTTLTISE